MSNETGVAASPSTRSRGGSFKRYLAMGIIILLGVGALAAGSFYEKEIRVLLNLQVWRRGEARQLVEEFIQRVQSDEINEAIELVDSASYKPIEKDGKVTGLQHQDESGFGRYKIYFKEVFVPGDATVKSVEIRMADQGSFVVLVGFSDKTEGWFVVKRFDDQYKIVGLPQVPGRYHF